MLLGGLCDVVSFCPKADIAMNGQPVGKKENMKSVSLRCTLDAQMLRNTLF